MASACMAARGVVSRLRIGRDRMATHLLLVALLREQGELHAALLLQLGSVRSTDVVLSAPLLLLLLLLLTADERDAHVERDGFALAGLARRGHHHFGELAGELVLLVLRHGIRVAAAPAFFVDFVFVHEGRLAVCVVRFDRVVLQRAYSQHCLRQSRGDPNARRSRLPSQSRPRPLRLLQASRLHLPPPALPAPRRWVLRTKEGSVSAGEIGIFGQDRSPSFATAAIMSSTASAASG